DGSIASGDTVKIASTGKVLEIDKVGFFSPAPTVSERLGVGEVGWFTAGIKEIADTQIGDTVNSVDRSAGAAIPGFKPAMPVVFSGLYPTDTEDYPK
ncbi:MAG: elongation factor 4, partial [Gammaproteobacteria bacterium]